MKTILLLALCLSSLAAFAYPGIQPGDRVITNYGDNRIGVVTQLFYNGTARVQFDRRGSRIVDTSSLSDAVQCSHGICAGARVIHSYGHRDTGIVVEVFRNGLAKVDWDRSRRDGIVSTYYLQALRGPQYDSCGYECRRPRDYDVYDNQGTCRYGYCD